MPLRICRIPFAIGGSRVANGLMERFDQSMLAALLTSAACQALASFGTLPIIYRRQVYGFKSRCFISVTQAAARVHL